MHAVSETHLKIVFQVVLKCANFGPVLAGSAREVREQLCYTVVEA